MEVHMLARYANEVWMEEIPTHVVYRNNFHHYNSFILF